MPESNHYEIPPTIDDEQPAVQPPEAGEESEEPQTAETDYSPAAELSDKLSRLNVSKIKTMILLSEGLEPPQIAERLGLSLNTTYTYAGDVRKVFGEAPSKISDIVQQAVDYGLLDKEKAMAAVSRPGRNAAQRTGRPGLEAGAENEKEAQAPREPWEDRFFKEATTTLDELGSAGFTENPDLLIPINPGPILDELIKSGIVPETKENETPWIDFYAAAVALLLGQKSSRQFLVNSKTSEKAHKNVRELVDYRIRVAKGSKLYKPPT
jgi:DNA-binding CsgD family transcriptional regulator